MVGPGASARPIGFARWTEKPYRTWLLVTLLGDLAAYLTLVITMVVFRGLGACVLMIRPLKIGYFTENTTAAAHNRPLEGPDRRDEP